MITATLSLTSQEFVIIDDPIHGGSPIPFNDTILSVDSNYGNEHYFIDLDQDEVNDISVYLRAYMGGTGEFSYIQFWSYGNFQTLIDTNFLTTFQTYDFEKDTLITWVGKYTIVKTYYAGDTIHQEQESRQDATDIVYFKESYSPPCTLFNVTDFIGDTLHAAFKRKSELETTFYNIKIYIPSRYSLHLISAKTNDHINAIPITYTVPVSIISVDYFDLYGRSIPKPTNGFYIERKVTDKGIVSTKNFIH